MVRELKRAVLNEACGDWEKRHGKVKPEESAGNQV